MIGKYDHKYHKDLQQASSINEVFPVYHTGITQQGASELQLREVPWLGSARFQNKQRHVLVIAKIKWRSFLRGDYCGSCDA